MDNNFIKDMRACQIESRITAEQIGQLTNLDNLYELIDIAYKAGYIACRVNECHRAELDTLVNNFDYINQELLMMQTALPELVEPKVKELMLMDNITDINVKEYK